MENFIRWAKRIVKRVTRFFIRIGKALAAWARSRRPKKLSRKQKKRARKIADQKATGEMVAAAFAQPEPMILKPTPEETERLVNEIRTAKAVTLADLPEVEAITLYDADPEAETWQGQLAKRKQEAEIESLENQLQDTKAILRVTKHSKSRQKLQKRAADLEKRLKEFQPLKNNI